MCYRKIRMLGLGGFGGEGVRGVSMYVTPM